MPQLLNDFLLRQLIAALDAIDAARSAYDRSGIVAYTVIKKIALHSLI